MTKSVNGVQPVYVLLVLCMVALVAVLSDCSSKPDGSVTTTTTNISREQSNSADVTVAAPLPESREESSVERHVEEEDRLDVVERAPVIAPARRNESRGLRGLRLAHRISSYWARMFTYRVFWFIVFLFTVVCIVGNIVIPHADEWIEDLRTFLHTNVAKVEGEEVELRGIVAKQTDDMQDVLDFLARFQTLLTDQNVTNMKKEVTGKIGDLVDKPSQFIKWDTIDYIMDPVNGINNDGAFDDFVRYVAANLTEEFRDMTIFQTKTTESRLVELENWFVERAKWIADNQAA